MSSVRRRVLLRMSTSCTRTGARRGPPIPTREWIPTYDTSTVELWDVLNDATERGVLTSSSTPSTRVSLALDSDACAPPTGVSSVAQPRTGWHCPRLSSCVCPWRERCGGWMLRARQLTTIYILRQRSMAMPSVPGTISAAAPGGKREAGGATAVGPTERCPDNPMQEPRSRPTKSRRLHGGTCDLGPEMSSTVASCMGSAAEVTGTRRLSPPACHSFGHSAKDPLILPLQGPTGAALSEPELQALVDTVAAKLRRGEVVGLPTDTIYGVACLAQLTSAVKRIYDIKGRESSKPIAICVAEPDDLSMYAEVTVKTAVLRDLLPGPVTLCFKRKAALNPELNPSTETVGIRIPDDRFIRALTAACGTSLALTSANLSGQPSSIEIGDFKDIWEDLGVIVDAGRRNASRKGSTVVDLSVPSTFAVIRNGDDADKVLACLRRHGLVERATVSTQ